MSLEIKNLNVENEEEEKIITVFQGFGWKLKSSQRIFNQTSVARGAVSYQNLTYIHSENETVDFTKLVFERDTEMPNYDEIVELEEEFWRLSDICPSSRPVDPELMGFEDWVKKTKPSVFSASKKNTIIFGFYVICGILFGLLVYFLGNLSGDIPASLPALFLSIIISLLIVPVHLFVSRGLFALFNCQWLKRIDLHANNFLRLQYSKYSESTRVLKEAASSYDNMVDTMRRLLRKSKKLL